MENREIESKSFANGAARQRNYNRALRAFLLDRAGGRCEYCGNEICLQTGQIDHVDPSGEDNVENYRIACPACNASKGNKTLEEFREYQDICLARGALPMLGFTAAQVQWLMRQPWFPYQVNEPHQFWFEMEGK